MFSSNYTHLFLYGAVAEYVEGCVEHDALRPDHERLIRTTALKVITQMGGGVASWSTPQKRMEVLLSPYPHEIKTVDIHGPMIVVAPLWPTTGAELLWVAAHEYGHLEMGHQPGGTYEECLQKEVEADHFAAYSAGVDPGIKFLTEALYWAKRGVRLPEAQIPQIEHRLEALRRL